MEKLIGGIHRFRTEYWNRNRELFRRLAEHGQSPEALFVTCCDARVVPTVIVHGRPGDLFINVSGDTPASGKREKPGMSPFHSPECPPLPPETG